MRMLNACRAPADNAVYKPRNPRHSHYYRCIEAHFEELEGAWEERYQRTCGFWRPLVMDVIYKYLDCGDLHFGFARVRYDTCGHEYLLAFSCKRRHFCPSCHQKRVVEFGEWLYGEVLKQVPHRQWVFSIPKRLRIYFMFDRRLLAKLSQCAWTVLSGYLKQGAAFDDAVPGAVIAVQTFGDFQNFNPHLHIIATDGCFYGNGGFAAGPRPNPSDLETAFRLEVLKMLKNEGKITGLIIENMLSWHHSGFNAYCGEAISGPPTKKGLNGWRNTLSGRLLRKNAWPTSPPPRPETVSLKSSTQPRTAEHPEPLRRWIGWLSSSGTTVITRTSRGDSGKNRLPEIKCRPLLNPGFREQSFVNLSALDPKGIPRRSLAVSQVQWLNAHHFLHRIPGDNQEDLASSQSMGDAEPRSA